jgi:hypothetical protein
VTLTFWVCGLTKEEKCYMNINVCKLVTCPVNYLTGGSFYATSVPIVRSETGCLLERAAVNKFHSHCYAARTMNISQAHVLKVHDNVHNRLSQCLSTCGRRPTYRT